MPSMVSGDCSQEGNATVTSIIVREGGFVTDTPKLFAGEFAKVTSIIVVVVGRGRAPPPHAMPFLSVGDLANYSR